MDRVPLVRRRRARHGGRPVRAWQLAIELGRRVAHHALWIRTRRNLLTLRAPLSRALVRARDAARCRSPAVAPVRRALDVGDRRPVPGADAGDADERALFRRTT